MAASFNRSDDGTAGSDVRTWAAATTRHARATMTVSEAALLLGLSESAAYQAAARGEIPAIKIGRRVLVKRDQLIAMIVDPAPPTIAETT
jgi:excisionase family DNA binding protein